MPKFCFHGNSNCQRELTDKITHSGYVSHFVYPSCVSENFDFQGFWPLRIMLLWTCNKKSVQLSASCSLGFKSRCRVVESHGHSMVSDLRSNHQVFYNNVSIYISSSTGTQVLPQYFDNICFYFLVLTIAILLGMNGSSLQFPVALPQWLAMVGITLCALWPYVHLHFL